MTDRLNVTLLGSKFMGRAHSNAWGQVSRFFDVAPSPTMHTVVARNADDLNQLIGNLEGVDRVSFVTHSLGGLVVRDLLAREGTPWRGRIAVCSPLAGSWTCQPLRSVRKWMKPATASGRESSIERAVMREKPYGLGTGKAMTQGCCSPCCSLCASRATRCASRAT